MESYVQSARRQTGYAIIEIGKINIAVCPVWISAAIASKES